MCTCALAAEAGTRAAKVGIVCAHVRGDGHGESKQADGMPRGVKAEMNSGGGKTSFREPHLSACRYMLHKWPITICPKKLEI